MSKSFYNTTNETGDKLSLFDQKAGRQETVILEWFTKHPDDLRTPFEIWDSLFTPEVPITSVRRAISNLTKRGLLVKTDKKKLEEYGRENYCWKLKQ